MGNPAAAVTDDQTFDWLEGEDTDTPAQSSEMAAGGSLLDGHFDEAANQASFDAAVQEWRSGEPAAPPPQRSASRPGTANRSSDVQTDAPPAAPVLPHQL